MMRIRQGLSPTIVRQTPRYIYQQTVRNNPYRSNIYITLNCTADIQTTTVPCYSTISVKNKINRCLDEYSVQEYSLPGPSQGSIAKALQ